MPPEITDQAFEQAIRDAAAQAAEAAVRAMNIPNPADRPGGSTAVPNVNLNRPQLPKLSSMIRAIGRGEWTDAPLERDLAQATQELFLRDDHEPGVSFAIPSTRSAMIKVLDEARIADVRPALRSWASRAADLEAVALEAIRRGDYRAAQAAMRDAGEGSTGAGGALVVPQYMQDYFTLSLQTATAFSNCPGVSRIPVKSNLVLFPRESVMPASAVYAEGGTLSATDPTFAQQSITIKKQAGYNQFSNELLADATPEYEAFIGKSLGRSLALRQDYEYLLGDGTGNHVLGLKSYGGATAGYSVGTNGDAWGQSYNATGPVMPGTDFPLSMLGLARAAGWEPNAWIGHPNVMSNGLAKAKDGNGRYLLESIGGVFGAPVAVPNIGALSTQITYQPSPWKAMLLGSPFLMTAQIPMNVTVAGSSDTGSVFLGDFNFAHILERQAIELAKSDQILFTTDQTAVRVTARSAIVLLAPGAFMVQTGVRASTVAA